MWRKYWEFIGNESLLNFQVELHEKQVYFFFQ